MADLAEVTLQAPYYCWAQWAGRQAERAVRTVRLQKLQRLLDKRTQIVVEMKAKIEEVADEYLTQDHQYQPTIPP